MIKEAIQCIQEMTQAHILQGGNGRVYTDGQLTELPAAKALSKHFELHTLSGLVDYIGKDFDKNAGAAVFIDGPDMVSLRTALFGDFRQRELFCAVSPFKGNGFPFGKFMDQEQFVIQLQACFVPDENTDAILRVVGNLASEAVATYEDDGITQRATARTGIGKVANVSVPNPVTLRPYRTFQEIEQPTSRFVLRLRGGDQKEDERPSVALFEADDQQWKVEAVNSIRRYLAQHLEHTLVFA